MPLNIQDKLPAKDILKKENIFIMDQSRAIHQDIRPMKIAILNLMPLKISTETHILRVLSNSPLQIEITLLRTKDHVSKHTPIEHLEAFYKTFDEIESEKYDGLIITGAPIEHLEFEEVDYWDELKRILDWSVKNVTSTLNICWAAQAALYHLYDVPKHHLNEKLFGIFEHSLNIQHSSLTRGFDDVYLAPHSRYTEVRKEDIEKSSDLIVVSESPEAGVYLVMSKNGKQVFVTGHSEYDPNTLKEEYERDHKKGVQVKHPENYYIDNNPNNAPLMRWRSHANLLYMNWLNYFVYQITPYNLDEIK